MGKRAGGGETQRSVCVQKEKCPNKQSGVWARCVCKVQCVWATNKKKQCVEGYVSCTSAPTSNCRTAGIVGKMCVVASYSKVCEECVVVWCVCGVGEVCTISAMAHAMLLRRSYAQKSCRHVGIRPNCRHFARLPGRDGSGPRGTSVTPYRASAADTYAPRLRYVAL